MKQVIRIYLKGKYIGSIYLSDKATRLPLGPLKEHYHAFEVEGAVINHAWHPEYGLALEVEDF